MSSEKDLSTEELLKICNREENFRSVLLSLLQSETIHHFDAVINSAEENTSEVMVPFLNDLREIYENETLRSVVISLLREELTEAQIRGVSFLLSGHQEQIQRVELLRTRMYRIARETIELYVPAFDGLTRFLGKFDRKDASADAAALNDSFYKEIADASKSDRRITPAFLEKICQSESFRKEIEAELDEYPDVVSTIWKMAENLVQAQRYIADIEIEDLLHDIEEHSQE